MLVVRLDEFDDSPSWRSVWHCLAHGAPFRSLAWLESWWRQYGSGRQLYLLQVTDACGAVVGMAPWFLDTSVRQGRAIRPLGCGEVCTDYLGVLATREHHQQVALAIAEWLTDAAQGRRSAADRWDLLDLNSVDSEDAVVTKLVAQLTRLGSRVHDRPAMNCWRVALPENWDGYLRMLSKMRRKRVRRIERNWLNTGRVRICRVKTEDQLASGMKLLVDLHQKRRRSLGQPGCFASGRFHQFLHQAAGRLLADDALKLAWLEIDGRQVAVEFYLTGAETVYAYQAGLDPDCLAQQPGQVIQVAMLREAIEDQQSTFDFLRGDEPYKAYWKASPHRCHDYRIVPAHRSAQLRHQVWKAGDTMKQWMKSGLQLVGTH